MTHESQATSTNVDSILLINFVNSEQSKINLKKKLIAKRQNAAFNQKTPSAKMCHLFLTRD